MFLTGSEQNQNPVFDSAYSIESIGSNVAIFRNPILTLNTSMLRYKGIPKEIFIVRN